MSGHLLLISLGPIQDFIASARRCQDLWFGSWLLSELARSTAEALAPRGDGIIFPAGLAAAEEGRGRPGIANLILASLPPGRDPTEQVRAARAAQQGKLLEIAEQAWSPIWSNPAFLRERALSQLRDLIEFHWVALPEDGRGYATLRRELYGRMAAIKNTRCWPQPQWPTSGAPKSSLDGQRESVISPSIYKGKDALSPEQRRRRFGISGSEQLCGVGLLKRLGAISEGDALFRGRRPPFHSTSHTAVSPLLERINAHPGGPAAARNYLDTLETLGLRLDHFRIRGDGGPPTLCGCDGSLLLESRIPAHFEQEHPGFSELTLDRREEKIRAARGALSALLRAVEAPSVPCPYYAFLLADGDRMGRLIDGIPTEAGHRALAGALNSFALGCRDLLAEHRGTLIFSGGDDVLALLPLHTALACSRRLAEHFHRQLAPVARAHWRPPADDPEAPPPKPSLSVGLAISHCREPMSEARALAKQAEALAKRSRDALAIILDRRSGAERSAVGSWGEPTPLDRRLAIWGRILSEGDLSTQTAHDIEAVAAHFDGLPTSDQHRRIGELRALLEQVLRRKRQRGGAPGARTDELSTLLDTLGETPVDRAPSERVRGFASELLIARLFMRAHRDAGSTWEIS